MRIPTPSGAHFARERDSTIRTLARDRRSDRFREILTAYETLNDPNRRGNYDRLLRNTRATIPRVVEPLRPQAIPEPMLSRRRVVDRDSVSEPLASTRLSALVDELFQSWEEVFFRDLRRRDHI